ncbi:Desmoglein-2 [Dissostichus eleginoides]|uniref:Desmoglein-2 n=1 Tax=Dissostichus eleginoides TaxID=100907 RepID=A0AAD9CD12_DISEL|nr:Desmoglein-2 [Dissostichus eleginoides]
MARLSFSEVGLLLLLVLALVISAESGPRRQKTLRRKKREWILPPAKLMENTDYRHKEFIAKIRSDKDLGEHVDYYLTGEGADKEPFNLFVVDRKTGFVRITELLDREKCQFYNLTGVARFKDGKKAEDDVPLTVTVLDQNDNTPYFELQMGTITEESKPGSVVMQIKGNDNDEAGTINSEISYRIVSQEPAGTGHMFTLDRKTGQLYVKEENLDRETIDFYKLVVEGTDMGGGSSGLVGTGTVEVKVLDINDNIPTLEKSEYDGEVEENVADVVVMRIKALDKDLRHSDNWLTVFQIAKGNEDNIFSIETDKETNEGVLKLIKAVDYEDVQNLELGLIVTNVAPFVKGGPILMDVDVHIGEEDPNEAPKDGVITVFAAVDPDTGLPAEDVNYAKAFDPENWLTIDEKTAEIKLNRVPDRESPFVVNGTYIAKILAITDDMPSKTATGTIAIQVLDSNDHCPTLTTTHSTQCTDETTVYVTAFDEDANPNGAPFTFRVIPDGTRGSWDVEVVNKTSAALHSRDLLWPGLYEVQVEVLDAQGLSCPSNEIFTVDVCTCVETKDCKIKAAKLETTSTELSAPAISLLLSAMCLLLFIPLLMLFCQCGAELFPDSFRDMPWETKEQLISYHTEGRGEDKEVPLHSISESLGPQKTFGTAQGSNSKGTITNTIENNQTTTIHEGFLERFRDTRQSWMEVDNNAHRLTRDFGYGYGSATISRNTLQHTTAHTTALYEDIALPDAFLNDYYSQKAMCALPAKDCSLEYTFEGQGSSAGSVGCCSLLETNNDLQFLDDLGPKFKTLSDICSPPKPTPKPSLTHKIVGAVQTTVNKLEPVVMPKVERSVETEHTDVRKETVMSSTNISKSSVNTVSTAHQYMTLPNSKVTNITHHSATLPPQARTVFIQPQPVYYTTNPVLQPMHYVVQPQLHNTVMLAEGSHGANFPGLYVVSGPQGSPPGLVIQGIEGPKSPASPVSPTCFLPGSPGVSPGSGPAKGWKMIGPNPDGKYMLVKDKRPDDAGEVDPGSPQGNLPRGAILVKEAAPPQGVLDLAAQGRVYGILPGQTAAKRGDDNINVPEVEEESLEEGTTTSIEQNVSIIDHQDEFIEGEAVSGRSSSLEDPLVSEESNDDEEKDEDSVKEDASNTVQVEDMLISGDSDGEEEEEPAPFIQQDSSFSDDQEEENGREDTPDTSIYVEEESRRFDDSATGASAQVAPTSYSEIKVVEKTLSSVSESDPDSGETRTLSSIAKSKVDEEAGNLVQNESLRVTGEATGEGPYTAGKTLMDDVSRASDDTHGAEAIGVEVSPVQFQTVMSPIPRNKSRKSKEDSKKNPKSPKSPSGKCKQQ